MEDVVLSITDKNDIEIEEIINLKKEVKMPRGDKTGPNGNGPKTGRGLGYCTGNNLPGFENNITTYGRGNGFGRRNHNGNGFGRGMGFGYRSGFDNGVKEKTLVQNEINILKDQLESLEKRLKEL